jgi:hypothetical protein
VIAINQFTPPRGARFEVIDAGSSRRDLERRKELKFALPGADVGKLRRLLEANGRRQIHNDAVSTVNSVYFDDARFSTCRANLDGLGRRTKVRLRWYDTPAPGQEFYFEIKWRDNRITGKHRLKIRSDQAACQLPYSAIVAALQHALPAQHRAAFVRYCEPAVLVRYRREHFTSDDGGLRATIDYGISYFDQTGKSYISTSFGLSQDLVVLEGKVPVGREYDLATLLHPFGARLGRCSKYVNGCRMLGLVHE